VGSRKGIEGGACFFRPAPVASAGSYIPSVNHRSLAFARLTARGPRRPSKDGLDMTIPGLRLAFPNGLRARFLIFT
ncbi:hypothetical protein, partial [Escherichia coli]|uniref:hypothetical protein n=1 Tax=Escherichia coli TaxID=562 RepID=UPI0019544968